MLQCSHLGWWSIVIYDVVDTSYDDDIISEVICINEKNIIKVMGISPSVKDDDTEMMELKWMTLVLKC